jgi:molybdopterin biosynthesis enzyme
MPGNPVSCLVTNHLFCAPAIKRLKGYAISECMHAQAQVTVMQVSSTCNTYIQLYAILYNSICNFM